MEKRKIQSWKRYILAFLIGTFIFVNGFLLAYSISYFEFQRISNAQGQISYQIFQDKLDYSFFDKDICSNNSLRKVSEDLRFQGRIIDDLERKLGKNNQKVLFEKKFYSLIELEHFEFVKKINKECNLGIPTILFFYSNKPEYSDEGEDLGNLLSSVYQRNNDLVIYSFDVDLDSELVDGLMKKYNIEEPLTIIINEKIKIIDLNDIKDIEQYLK